MHSGPHAVVRKVMRQGYYWPTMHEDAKKEIQKCDSCQIHSAIPKLPKTFMTSIIASWPFYQWGMDIFGPLKPLKGSNMFDLPRIIVTDNGTQFVNDPFKSCLMEGIKTRLGREKAGWVDELLNVLWAHRTSIKTSNEETPFSLTYRHSVRKKHATLPELCIGKVSSEERSVIIARLLMERRELAAIQEARYKTKLEQYCNKKGWEDLLSAFKMVGAAVPPEGAWSG
ncbi:reverse transcriptase domain-containing protein [Tanacetum coccineum]